MVHKYVPEFKAEAKALSAVIEHEKQKRLPGQKREGVSLVSNDIAFEVGITGSKLTRFLQTGDGLDKETVDALPKAIGYSSMQAVIDKAAELEKSAGKGGRGRA